MVVWSPDNDGQFVCVEPWQGLPSEANGGYDLTQRPCILHLSSGERYEYTVTVEPEINRQCVNRKRDALFRTAYC